MAAICRAVSFLVRRGHGQAHAYGWEWFALCLKSEREAASQERRARLADMALATRGAPEALERHLKELS